MKIKSSWWVFLPLFMASVGLKVYQLFFTDGVQAIRGLTQIRFSYFIDIIIGIMILLNMLVSVTDKQTENSYTPHRNIIAGMFGVLSSLAILFNAGYKFLDMYRSATYSVLWVISIPLALLAVSGIIVTTISLFSGKSNHKDISVMYLFPAIWSVVKLIAMFAQYTHLSVRTDDVTILLAYVLLTLFWFYQSALMVDIDTEKLSIKKTFIYGFGAVAFVIVCGLGQLKAVIDNNFSIENIEDIQTMAGCAELLLLGLYIIAFLASLAKNCKFKEPITINAMEQNFNNVFNDYVSQNNNKYSDKYLDKAEQQLQNIEFVEDNIEEDTYNDVENSTEDFVYKATADIDNNSDSYNPDLILTETEFSTANDMLDKMLKELE